MRVHVRVAVLGWLAVLGSAAVVAAPIAGADCNDSSGTTVCSQGEIRGTDAPPPQRPSHGAFGTWCTSTGCFPSDYGFGIVAP